MPALKNHLSLDAPVTVLHGAGERVADKLKRLDVETVRDLLFLMPLRYMDRTRLSPIGAIRPGTYVQVEGTIDLAQVRFGRRRSLLCRISDGTGALTLRFFHFNKSQQDRMQRGLKLRCYGQARFGAETLEMVHPEYQIHAPDHELAVDETLTPVYPAAEGLSQAVLRKLTAQALRIMQQHPEQLQELLPPELLEEFQQPELTAAINYVHRPPPDAITQQLIDGTHPAQQRLAFEELLAQYLSLQQLRAQLRDQVATPFISHGEIRKEFLHALTFQLTPAQKRTAGEILHDLQQPVPMLRLLQGDVGSGKTVIAALAALAAVESGYQAAIMAPTELLAEQHAQTLTHWLAPLKVPVMLLTGKLTRAERRRQAEFLNTGKPCVVIGTHALFQEDVSFPGLRLVIVDEQHRFGVHQRLALLEKGKAAGTVPHQLIMTATPIPRTLAMTIYADLDISIIDGLPPGRQPVNTVVMSAVRRDEVIDRIAQACAEGRQVYWVCPLVEESEIIQCEAAIAASQTLAEKLPQVSVGLIHGRLKPAEKEAVMRDFRAGKIQLLTATTVIEVGVDVPNASLMIIDNAERMGLFQLHQLRGRIGRGKLRSDCVLLYQPPLSEMAKIRLDTMRTTNDGFAIAKKDLELRGPGEMLGTRQTGLPGLRIADLIRDAGLLPEVHRAAALLMRSYPQIIPALTARWLGRDMDYGKV